MIKIPKNIYEEMIKHALNQTPIEACGYLAGIQEEAKVLYKMTNADNSEEHFSFIPQEQFDVFKKANKLKLRLIACYHSHPSTPARPSNEDMRLAYDPNISYIIISLVDTPDVKSFKIKDGKAVEEKLEVCNEHYL
ncbi:MAG: M67 family metallopeptidase [Campylobacteraceae bacterium]|jgi:proteasome lid subunit RPN8/RPN11|nr:M67 family metallopeptidase [Campylobacteraceae bacterium]